MPITTNLFDLTGHVALVTGGNSGIGLGMAEGLAAHGATVAIWGTNPVKNSAAAAKLREHGGTVLDLVCDVGDHQARHAPHRATGDEVDVAAAGVRAPAGVPSGGLFA